MPFVKKVSKEDVGGNPLVKGMLKLKLPKCALKVWNKEVFGDVNARPVLAQNKLQKIQDDIVELGLTKAQFHLKFNSELEKALKVRHDIDLSS